MELNDAYHAILDHLHQPNALGISAVHINPQLLTNEKASMVYALWRKLGFEDPTARAVYSLGTLYDCSEAEDYFRITTEEDKSYDRTPPFCRGIPELEKDLLPQMVALVTYKELLSFLGKKPRGYFHNHVTFFVDVEVFHTIEVELMLGRLISFIRDLVQPGLPGVISGERPEFRVNFIVFVADEFHHVAGAFDRFLDTKVSSVTLRPMSPNILFQEIEIPGNPEQQAEWIKALVIKGHIMSQGERHAPMQSISREGEVKDEVEEEGDGEGDGEGEGEVHVGGEDEVNDEGQIQIQSQSQSEIGVADGDVSESEGLAAGHHGYSIAKRRGAILLFMTPSQALETIVQPITAQIPGAFHYRILDVNQSTEEHVKHFRQHEGGELLIVDPSFPSVLGQMEIKHIISTGTTRQMGFDVESSQFVANQKALSQDELRRQRLWMERALVPSGHTPLHATTYSHLEAHARWDSMSDRLDGPLLALVFWTVYIWPKHRLGDMPVPMLHMIERAKIQEMWRRILIMKIIKQHDVSESTWVPNQELAQSVARFLELGTNSTMNVHIAAMLAHVCQLRVMGSLSTRASKTITRLAAIISCGIPSLLSLDYDVIESRNMDFGDLIRLAKNDSSGIGYHLGDQGSLWLALGLWHELNNTAEDIRSLRGDYISRAGRAVLLSKRSTLEVSRMSSSLDEALCISADIQEGEPTMLSSEEIDQVNEILLYSWMHQMVLFPYDESKDPVDLVSLQPVDCGSPVTLTLDWGKMRDDDAGNRGGFAAIYFNLYRDAGSGKLVPSELTLIPRKSFTKLQQQLGVPLSLALGTTYPVPTRAVP